MGTPGQVVYGVVFLASDRSRCMDGIELVIDGGRVLGEWRVVIPSRCSGLIGW